MAYGNGGNTAESGMKIMADLAHRNQYSPNLNQAIAPDAPSRVRDGLSCTEQLIQELHGAIGALEQRLEVVLTPGPPPMPGTGSDPLVSSPPIGSALHGRIIESTNALSAAIARLRAIQGRIEV